MSLDEIEVRLKERFPEGFLPLSQIPHPSLLKDSDIASERVVKAIKEGEKIAVIGDYDVDGVVSSSIVELFFREIGYEVEVIIPNRFSDGYGVTPKLLERVDADLVITVDNGIHGFNSAKVLKERGVDFIITDHHNPSDSLPDAFAVVNPKRGDCPYPHKEICGAQVIWLLLGEVKRVLEVDIDMSQYLDLLAVAIISDVMPIRGLNHSIVKVGLKKLQSSNRVANRVLMERIFSSSSPILSEDVAFQLSPRLNSSGRMSHAELSFHFLTSRNYFEASQLFEEIDGLNRTRKDVERDMFEAVLRDVDPSQPIILYYGEHLHEGVIGIVASRVVDRFQKPAFIFSKLGDTLKGSGRSLGNIDIFYLLKSSKEFLLKWGGHKMAGGLSLELSKFPQFRERVFEAMKIYKEVDYIEQSSLFGALPLEKLDTNLIQVISKFEPFGNENEKPIFQIEDALVVDARRIGRDMEYQKLIVEKDGVQREVLIFKKERTIKSGETVSLSFRPMVSTFRNETKVQAISEKILEK
jgi:single-stranded-DNA-specific exonuclease